MTSNAKRIIEICQDFSGDSLNEDQTKRLLSIIEDLAKTYLEEDEKEEDGELL